MGLIRKGGAGLWLVAVASTPPAPTTVRDRIHGRSQHPDWFPVSPSWRHPWVLHEREGLLYIFNWRMGEESREDLGGERCKVERRWTVTNSLGIVQSDRKRDPEIPQSNTTLPLRSLKVLVVRSQTPWNKTLQLTTSYPSTSAELQSDPSSFSLQSTFPR